MIGYSDEYSRVFKIFQVTKTNNSGWKHPGIMAKEITSDFNDGPVTFNSSGDIMYFSRNNSIDRFLKNVSDPSNKLGIYRAELISGTWTNIRPFSYNNLLYSFCTPALTPDGNRIYFSSDMPGGFGGMDLYFCDNHNGDWDNPVNLGPVINTPKNESFPYACSSGKLFFASDGHKGFGGKDLFYTQEINSEWIVPVHLDSAINSSADDFGLVTDSTLVSGYFTSNRRKTDDIFSFSSTPVEFENCDSMVEDNYCFAFYDEQHQQFDTMMVRYEWDFGDGIKRTGSEVKYCFPGSGTYLVKLNIIDEITGNPITEETDYTVDLEKTRQAYLNSSNVGLVDTSFIFDGLRSNLTGVRTTGYFWNFGDGFKPGRPVMKKTYQKKGTYTVMLGILGEDSLGRISKTCVAKRIHIYDYFVELNIPDDPDKNTLKNNALQTRIYCTDDLTKPEINSIKTSLTESGSSVAVNQYGILPSSFLFLDKIAAILKNNTDLRLEITLITMEGAKPDGTSENSDKWARELAFYLKNKEVNKNAVFIKGFSNAHPGSANIEGDMRANNGFLEFIFVKKQLR